MRWGLLARGYRAVASRPGGPSRIASGVSAAPVTRTHAPKASTAGHVVPLIHSKQAACNLINNPEASPTKPYSHYKIYKTISADREAHSRCQRGPDANPAWASAKRLVRVLQHPATGRRHEPCATCLSVWRADLGHQCPARSQLTSCSCCRSGPCRRRRARSGT